MRLHSRFFGFIVLVSSAFQNPAYCQNLDSLVQHAIAYSQSQLTKSVQAIEDSLSYPLCTLSDGTWRVVEAGNWTSGFFPGCLWYMVALDGDPLFRSFAERWMAGLEPQQFNTGTHDVGFIVYNSYGNAYRLIGGDHHRQVILQAAASLSTRYNSTVGCIRSWDWGDWSYPVIIDNMMNLELLFWAAKHGGSATLRDMAVSHALKTMQNHFRQDGSTYHIVSYDVLTGTVVEKRTHQGYSDESVWSRGQAWAIYGFTMAYREAGDPRFLETAEHAARYFLDHAPSDHIPYWDFLAPEIPNEQRDVSAAAIACSALLELSQVAVESPAKERYLQAAKELLSTLCQAPYLSEGTSSMGLLNHGVGYRPAGENVDVSLIYADFYFLEALHRYQVISDVPVPVTIAGFSAVLLSQTGPVRIEWETLSETNSFGFYIQRKGRNEHEFAELPGAFVAGHGTSIVPWKYTYRDTLECSNGSWYRLKQVDLDGTVHLSEPAQVMTVSDVREAIPLTCGLAQNYPNPFNPETNIRYSVGGVRNQSLEAAKVRLAVYDLLGREVAVLVDEKLEPGIHEVTINGSHLSSGVYVYRLTAGNTVESKRMMLLK